MCATFYYSFKAEAVPNQIGAANGSASIHDSASITGSASKQMRVLTGAYGTESNPNAAKQNHGTTFSLETEPTFIKCWMPWGNAFHFSHIPVRFMIPLPTNARGPKQNRKTKWNHPGLPKPKQNHGCHTGLTSFVPSRPDKATGRPGRN